MHILRIKKKKQTKLCVYNKLNEWVWIWREYEDEDEQPKQLVFST